MSKPDSNPYLPYPDAPGFWALYPPGYREPAIVNVKQDPEGRLMYIHEKRSADGKLERIAIQIYNLYGGWWRRILLPTLPNKFFHADSTQTEEFRKIHKLADATRP